MPPPSEPTSPTPWPCDLVLEGGGIKGIALVGAIRSLEDHGYRVERVAGASVGAVVGALVAAGVSGAELEELVGTLDYRRVLRPKGPRFLPRPLYVGVRIATRGWIYSGDYLREWLGQILADKGKERFGDLKRHDPPPGGRGDDYRLMVTATDLTRCELLRLPYDYQTFDLPVDDQLVVDAVCASAAFPFVFRSTTIRPMRGLPSTAVDGGFLSNFPIDAFDRADGQCPRWPTFGIKLFPIQRDLDQARRSRRMRPPAVQQLNSLLVTMLVGRDQAYLRQPWVAARSVLVDTSAVGIFDTALAPPERQTLIDAGRRSMDEFLRDWNFDAYVKRFRS
jgi:NTE family protein